MTMKTLEYRTAPYSEDEQRVCDFLQEIAPEIGCGDDPIGFMMTQLMWFQARAKRFESTLSAIRDHPGDAAEMRQIANGAINEMGKP